MKHIVSFSGGKDSTAMLLRMIELNMKIDEIIFADTTLEFPEMYEWVDKIEKIVGRKITRVTAKHSWDDWFYGIPKRGKYAGIKIRGFPLKNSPCWWSRDCKVGPMNKKYGENNVIYIGIALDEKHRSEAKAYKKLNNDYRFPLIEWGWTEDDCNKYLDSIGLPHPLKWKFKRTGCWLCPKQNLQSLENLFLHYPELWMKLKQYEKDSPHGFRDDTTLDMLEKRFIENKKQRKLV